MKENTSSLLNINDERLFKKIHEKRESLFDPSKSQTILSVQTAT